MRLRPLPVLALVPLVLLAGCLEPSQPDGIGDDGTNATPGGGGGGDDDGAGNGSDVPVESLARGQYSGVEGPARRVIDTQADWETFWQEHASHESPGPQRPEVDFAQQRVVAAVLEDKPNGCWAAAITGVAREQGEIVVEVTSYSPPPDRMCASVIVQPFHFVAVPAGDEPVTFTERTEQGPPPADEEAPASSGQGGDGDGDDGGAADGPQLRDLEHGSHSGVAGPVRRVISDQAEWEAFWEQHGSRQMPPPERPPVDFANERVVAVVLEDKPNGCWAVRVTEVTAEGADAEVEVTTYAPPPDAFCADVITNPYHFVALQGVEGEVSFTERETTQPPMGAAD